MIIVWDEPKRVQNLETHGLDSGDARDPFDFASAQTTASHHGGDDRLRFKSIGVLDNTLVVLVFSPLGTEAISLISLRPASRKERKAYVSR